MFWWREMGFALAIAPIVEHGRRMKEPKTGMHTRYDVTMALEAARNRVLLVPSPEHAVLRVTGKDRTTWLNGLVTCDLVATRTRGEAVYGLAVRKNGRVLADLVILVEPDEIFVVAARAARDRLVDSLEHHLVMEDVAVEKSPLDVTFAYGPQAMASVSRASGGFVASFDRFRVGGAVLVGADVSLVGAEVGDEDVAETLRLEQGVPRFGVDFDETTYPQEAGLEKTAVSFSKGCYLGQEVVCMLAMRGRVTRRLVSLVLDGVPVRGAVVRDPAGDAVGEITSAVASPTLGRAVALAMVKQAYVEPGTRVQVEGREALVVASPCP